MFADSKKSISAKDPPCTGGILKILDLLFYFSPFSCKLHLQQQPCSTCSHHSELFPQRTAKFIRAVTSFGSGGDVVL